MFNPQVFENSRPDGIPVLEVTEGETPNEVHLRRFVPLLRSDVKGEIVGPLASLRLIQTFAYKREECDHVLEALYRFPLPGDAAVTAVRVRFGDVEIRTELKDRRQAEDEYDEARKQGHQAVLATRESADVFTLRIAGLKPDQETVIETFYVQLVRAEGSGWSLRIPLTTAPRYVRSDEEGGRPAEGQPLALLRDPGHRFRLDLTLCDADGVKSPTHTLDVQRQDNRTRVRLSEGEVLPDRDCVLTWRPLQHQADPALHVLVHDHPDSEHAYFLALVAPPATRDPGRRVPREVVLLVDHSGSMEGAKWDAADWAVERFLSGLSAQDQFALCLFHTATRWFDKSTQAGNSKTIEKAVKFLKSHRDSGGTELGVALEQALGLAGGEEEAESARHVLVMTDAEVTDSGRILRLADREKKRAHQRRISVLCIDASPNAMLATELAERGGGVARFLTSDPDEGDITTALDEVLADWAEPVLTGLRLEINRGQVEAAGREVFESDHSGWTCVDLGDLPAGRAAWVVGRVSRAGAPLEFRIRTARKHEIAAASPKPSPGSDSQAVLKALFGARRIRGLEYVIHSGATGEELDDQLRRLGYDPNQVAGTPSDESKVYAENLREVLATALRKLLVRESLEYGLACSETAFFAVRSEAGKPVEGTVIVANAFPAGWSTPRFGSHAMPSGFAQGFTGGAPILASAQMRRGASGLGGMAKRLGDMCKSITVSAQGLPASGPVDASIASPPTVVFRGTPQLTGGEALLYDSTAGKAVALPAPTTIDWVAVSFTGGAPKADSIDVGLSLLIYVDDLAAPRAKVRLADIVRQGGRRPLHISRVPGETVRIVLVDPGDAWKDGALEVEIALGCG